MVALLAGKDDGHEDGKDEGQLGVVSIFDSASTTMVPLFGAYIVNLHHYFLKLTRMEIYLI